MNERSRKMTGLSRRLMAWLLCCVFLVAASPVSATTLEDSTPAAETTVTEQLTEATTAEPVTTSVTEPMTTIQSITTENVTVDTSSSEPGTTAEAGTPEATTANGEISTTAEGTSEGTTEVTTATEGVSGTEKSAAEALYERIMACTTYEAVEGILSALTEKEQSLMDEFTEEQNTALKAKMEELGAYAANAYAGYGQGGQDGQGGQSSSYNTFVVNTGLGNVDAIYFAYHSNSDVSDNISFETATDGGQIKIEKFSSKSNRGSTYGYLLIFVKPSENYLLTQGKATGNCDIYSISSGAYGNIADYPGIQTIAAQAAKLGYVGVLGYMRSPGQDVSDQTITFNAVSPDITVKAVSDKTSDVKPGDELTFTVTITPGTIANSDAKVEKVTVNSLTVNGGAVKYSDLIRNSDGTYTTTVKYTATEADCDSGSVELNVTARVDYSNTLGVSGEQSLDSSAYIVKSAETACEIAPQNSVTYKLKYIAEGIDEEKYPDTIKESEKPQDVTDYKGATVNVDSKYGTTRVDDPTNRGTWTFDGWYKGGEKMTQVTIGDKRVVLEGTWTFTQYPDADLTIKKTLSGNMYNKSDKFTFTVTYQDNGETKKVEVTLGKDQTSDKISIPVGAEVAITETNVDKYVLSVTSATYGENEKLDYKSTDNVITFTMPSNDVSVVINNAKNVVPDTGVILDTLPYILILAVVIIGGVLLIGRRRSRNDA